MSRICIVEDDESIREIVLYALRSAGFDAAGFENGTDFFASLPQSPPALVLLDIMLPGDDGLTILRRLKSNPHTSALPVIMLTAKNSEYDKVKGLDMGADDYIAKPFGVVEMISRVRAVLRRTSDSPQEQTLTVGPLSLHGARREVTACGEKVELTFKEYELLSYLALNAGLALSREKIMDAVWGFDYEGESRTVDMHIKTLRQKLGPAGGLIKTVRSVGYKLETEG